MRPNRSFRVSRIRLCAAVVAIAAFGSHAFAQLASRPVSEWVKVLDAEERLAALKIDDVVTRLELKAGDVVADLGAGSGPFVVPFAEAVSPKGRVYAVEIDRDFFPLIHKRTQAAGVENVQTVLGAFTDPRLPVADIDLAFLHDVLHHVRDKASYLRAVTKYLAPGARIAIIDYHPAHSPHREEPDLVVPKQQAVAWLAEAGFEPIDEVALFADKWFVVFAARH